MGASKQIGAQSVPNCVAHQLTGTQRTHGQSSSCWELRPSDSNGVWSGIGLLISGSEVRVLHGPPIESGASKILGAPDLLLMSDWCPTGMKTGPPGSLSSPDCSGIVPWARDSTKDCRVAHRRATTSNDAVAIPNNSSLQALRTKGRTHGENYSRWEW